MSVGVNPFGFDLDDDDDEFDGPPSAAEVRERLAEREAVERREQRIRGEMMLETFIDALPPHLGMDRLTSQWEDPLVYFVQAEGGGPVKIGMALDYALRRRLTALQIANAEPLVVRRLIHGGARLERLLHLRFAEYHIRGEWFRDEGDLAAIIRPTGDLRVVLRAC